MKKGILIYDAEGARRNEWFIDEIISTGKSLSLDIRLAIVDDGEALEVGDIDFALVRTINPKVNLRLEQKGIPTFNNYKTSYAANDKWQTYLLATELGIPVMDTVMAEQFKQKPGRARKYPFILKARDGHGGKEVFWIDSDVGYESFSAGAAEGKYIIQAPADNLGRDVRVYCLGEDIIVAILRSSKSDFRSNFSLGGDAEIFTPTREMREIVSKLYSRLEFGLVGVDFIFNRGKWVLNEIEDVVGTRMIYAKTDIDIVMLYLEYVKNKIKSGS